MPSPGTLSPHHTLSPQVDSKTGFLSFPWALSPKPPGTPPLQKIKDTIKENIPLCRGTRFKAKAKGNSSVFVRVKNRIKTDTFKTV
jgi:hypothetical protein